MSLKSDMRQLTRELGRQGFTVRKTENGHYKVIKDGYPDYILPATPSDWRTLANSVADLRRRGFIWHGRGASGAAGEVATPATAAAAALAASNSRGLRPKSTGLPLRALEVIMGADQPMTARAVAEAVGLTGPTGVHQMGITIAGLCQRKVVQRFGRVPGGREVLYGKPTVVAVTPGTWAEAMQDPAFVADAEVVVGVREDIQDRRRQARAAAAALAHGPTWSAPAARRERAELHSRDAMLATIKAASGPVTIAEIVLPGQSLQAARRMARALAADGAIKAVGVRGEQVKFGAPRPAITYIDAARAAEFGYTPEIEARTSLLDRLRSRQDGGGPEPRRPAATAATTTTTTTTVAIRHFNLPPAFWAAAATTATALGNGVASMLTALAADSRAETAFEAWRRVDDAREVAKAARSAEELSA